jgi:hypothetical protein
MPYMIGPNKSICSSIVTSQLIEVKSDLRDLGVRISSSLNFNLHIEKTVQAASKLVGWCLRTFGWEKQNCHAYLAGLLFSALVTY